MSTISNMNQIIDDEEGVYRVHYRERVGYLSISTDFSTKTPSADHIC